MKILYLGPTSPLVHWLQLEEQVTQTTDQDVYLAPYDWVISYNYRYKLSQHFLDHYGGRVVNLHISLLPWNRGAHPNLWAWLEDTPHGVSIHRIDAGLDTGPLLVQRPVLWDERDRTLTLADTYRRLQNEVQALFRTVWPVLRLGGLPEYPQPPGGTFHRSRDLERVQSLLPQGWDTPVHTIRGVLCQNRLPATTDPLRRATATATAPTTVTDPATTTPPTASAGSGCDAG